MNNQYNNKCDSIKKCHRERNFRGSEKFFMNIVAVLLIVITVVSGSEAYTDLASAVESGQYREVASILEDPTVDPSFDDHRLIRDSECHFGAKTTKLLLRDHRFDPGAHDNCFLKKAFKSGNIFAAMLLLSHPKVDPSCVDGICRSNGDEYDELQEMMSSLKGRLIAVREGMVLDMTKPMTVHAYITLLYCTMFYGRDDLARGLLSISRYMRVSMPYDIALYLDHPVIGRLALELNAKFR